MKNLETATNEELAGMLMVIPVGLDRTVNAGRSVKIDAHTSVISAEQQEALKALLREAARRLQGTSDE